MVTYELEIDERTCYITDCNDALNSGPFIFWPLDPVNDDDWENVGKMVHFLVPNSNFTLIGFKVNAWDYEMGPWETNALGGRKLGGGADNVLNWLVSSCIPELEKKLSVAYILSEAWENEENPIVEEEGWYREYYIGGYSLAGLFGLWAYLESCVFSGVVSASGSLWYPGFRDYIAGHELIDETKVYLSLGNKEEKSKDKTLASVGYITREMSVFFNHAVKDGVLKDFKYEIEEGNHFKQPQIRLAKGIAWLLDSNVDLLSAKDLEN